MSYFRNHSASCHCADCEPTVHGRIRLWSHRNHKCGGKWLDDKMIDYAQKTLLEYQKEEPDAGWVLQVSGDIGNWHDYNES